MLVLCYGWKLHWSQCEKKKKKHFQGSMKHENKSILPQVNWKTTQPKPATNLKYIMVMPCVLVAGLLCSRGN